MKDKHTIYAFLAILLMINVANAGILNDLKDRFIPQPQIKQPINQPGDDFKTLYDEISALNTNHNIMLLEGYMRAYDVNIIKIHVIDYNRDFYVLSGAGTTLQSCTSDKTIDLTVSQIRQIMGFISDGKLSWYEKLQLWKMYV